MGMTLLNTKSLFVSSVKVITNAYELKLSPQYVASLPHVFTSLSEFPALSASSTMLFAYISPGARYRRKINRKRNSVFQMSFYFLKSINNNGDTHRMILCHIVGTLGSNAKRLKKFSDKNKKKGRKQLWQRHDITSGYKIFESS